MLHLWQSNNLQQKETIVKKGGRALQIRKGMVKDDLDRMLLVLLGPVIVNVHNDN